MYQLPSRHHHFFISGILNSACPNSSSLIASSNLPPPKPSISFWKVPSCPQVSQVTTLGKTLNCPSRSAPCPTFSQSPRPKVLPPKHLPNISTFLHPYAHYSSPCHDYLSSGPPKLPNWCSFLDVTRRSIYADWSCHFHIPGKSP